MKKILLFGLLALFLSGCCSIVTRTYSTKNYRPYESTIVDGVRIFDAIHGPSLNTALGRQSCYDSKVMFPWLIVDLPLSFVVDTLCFPIDIW